MVFKSAANRLTRWIKLVFTGAFWTAGQEARAKYGPMIFGTGVMTGWMQL